MPDDPCATVVFGTGVDHDCGDAGECPIHDALTSTQEVRHVPFNPTTLGLMFSPGAAICAEQERDGWRCGAATVDV